MIKHCFQANQWGGNVPILSVSLFCQHQEAAHHRTTSSVWSYLNSFRIGFDEQIQNRAAEVVRVTVWIAQLIGDCIQEKISSLVVQIYCQILEDIHVCTVHDGRHRRTQIFRSTTEQNDHRLFHTRMSLQFRNYLIWAIAWVPTYSTSAFISGMLYREPGSFEICKLLRSSDKNVTGERALRYESKSFLKLAGVIAAA